MRKKRVEFKSREDIDALIMAVHARISWNNKHMQEADSAMRAVLEAENERLVRIWARLEG